MNKFVAIVAIFLSILLLASAGALYWEYVKEENCWQYEGVTAIEKYEKLKTRTDVLRETSYFDLETSGTNPLQVIDKDYSGCNLGSNGQTVVRLSFNNKDELNKIQVFRNYVAPDYEMELIKEKQL